MPAMQRLGLVVPFALALGLAASAPMKAPAASAPLDEEPASSPNPLAAPPLVALLATAPSGDETQLFFQRPGEALSREVATLRHVQGGSVKGALLPGKRVVAAIADMEPRRDPSWGAWLLRLEEGQPPVTLADRVYTGTRPLVLDDGRVLVQRGRAGKEPTEEEGQRGRLRADEITIDAIDPVSGTARTLHAFTGYLAFLAGASGSEAFVYRVAPDHADIVAVDVNTGSSRALLPSILPFARDFSVDRESRSLVFTARDERSSETWVVDRLDLTTGARTRIARGLRMALVPHAWPGGQVAFNPNGDRGLTLLQKNGRMLPLRPLGDGVDVVRGLSPDARWAALLHTLPSELPVPFALSVETGQPIPIAAPQGMRVEIAGVLP